MDLTFHGAAREVTGSCHLVRANGRSLLLDCGLFQGRRSDVRAKNEALPMEASKVDAVILSHAHIDHAGRLPVLARRGFRGPIHTTPATRDLCGVMLTDAAHIQEKDAEFLARRNREAAPPLYDAADVTETLRLMHGTGYRTAVEVLPGIGVEFLDAGHILGSASVVLEAEEKGRRVRLAFSGDIGRKGLSIIGDPVTPADVDAVIMESTYGNRSHASVNGARAQLGAVVRDTAARGGRVLVPAFAVGRTQELLYNLHELLRQGAIPKVPIVIDSPLATEATRVFTRHTELYDSSEPLVRGGQRARLLDFPLVEFTPSPEESKALMERRGPMIVIAASGMAESGRILHHLLHGAGDARNTVLIVSFQAEHTLGRRIVERQPVLKVFGEEVPLRARVEVINGYSAHADRAGLIAWLDAVRARSPRLSDVWLVHGEPPAQDELAATLGSRGYRVRTPTPGTRAIVGQA